MLRYQHQISLPTIGEEGQKKLLNSAVLVIGAGGLGCPALSYLVGSGIGRIGILDGDKVSLSNLHRQLIYNENDIGQYKSVAAKNNLSKHNSEIDIVSYSTYLTLENAAEIISQYDLILDCTDQTSARYLINDICIQQDKTWIYGALHHHEGQISTFNHQGSGSYRCLFPQYNDTNTAPTCAEAGIIPTLAGIIGTMQANEALKILLGYEDILSDTLLLLDIRNYDLRKIKYERIDNSKTVIDKSQPHDLDHTNLSLAIGNLYEETELIDIRAPHEIEANQVAGVIHLDPTEVQDYIQQHSQQIFVVFCTHGSRSLFLTRRLRKLGSHNIYSLMGGVKAFSILKLEDET